MNLVRDEYIHRATLRPLFWQNTIWLPLENVYTRLRIDSTCKAGVKNDIPILKRFLGVLCEYQTAGDPNKGKDCAGGRGTPNEGRGFRMLVEGSPGIGKTTFCLKLAYDWAKQNSGAPFNFPEFELVLLLRCRDIDGKLMDAIPQQLFPEDVKKETEMELRNFIKNKQKRILIILDGLDELPKKSKRHVDALLEGNIFRDCNALITARQEKGIDTRKKFVFDACLKIAGFSEDCAIEYIRKHFRNLVPEQSSKGEKLVEEITRNHNLHAFTNNPLSLLLLCVVYEDHNGMLPSSRTNLYQIIVRCLLRRYCAKHNVKARNDNRDLEKQFERYIRPLGERAWNCLLDDRHSFRKDELKGLESDVKSVVCGLGLVYKEESSKRLNPQHEYCFLHKSFQEYLAALYVVHELRHNQINLFEHLDVDDVLDSFRQVCYFVCGIGGEEAFTLIAQIGQNLKRNWDFRKFNIWEFSFFGDILNESPNAGAVAHTLYSFIPFPRVVKLSLKTTCDEGTVDWCVFYNVKTFLSVAKLDTPEEVHIDVSGDDWDSELIREVASLSRLKTLDISIRCQYVNEEEELEALFQELSDGTSLSELRLPVRSNIKVLESAFVKGMKTLKEVTFRLLGPVHKSWARALDDGLPAFTLLSSVSFAIYGLVGDTALYFLERLLSHRSVSTFTLVTSGGMQDSLAEALARGLTGTVAIKRLNLHVLGKLSIDAATSIERAIVGNHSLNNLEASFLGELPDCWQAIAENIQTELAKRPQVSFAIYPNPLGQVTANQIRHLRPVDYGFPARQRFTLNVWGELSAEGAEALYEVVPCTLQSQVTLNIHGKLTDDFLRCTAKFVDRHVMLSPITINTWDRLTKEGKTLFEELKLDKSSGVTVKWYEFHLPQDKSTDDENVTIDNDTSLTALFIRAQNTSQQTINITINIQEGETYHFCYSLSFFLENITSLNTLALTINNYSDYYEGCFDGLGEGLKGNTSLSTFTLTVANYGHMSDDWMGALSNGLASNTSLNAFTLAVINYDILNFGSGLSKLLASKSSLNTFTLTVSNYGCLLDLELFLDNDLASHTSVSAFTLSVISYNVMHCGWGSRLSKLLASNTSLNTFTLSIANYDKIDNWMVDLGNGLASNTSLNSFTLAVTDYGNMSGDWMESLAYGLAKNTKMNTINLTINNYSTMNGNWGRTLGCGLSQCESLVTCNLTFNIYNEVVGDFLPGLIEELVKSKSLRTLRLEVDNQHLKWGSCEYDFSKLVGTLSLLELTVSFYGRGGQEPNRGTQLLQMNLW